MAYPRLLENDGQCIGGIGTDEAPWLNQMSNRMLGMMSSVAAEATSQGIPTFLSDPRDELAGQAVCGSPETIQGIVVNTTAGDKPQTLGLLPPSAQFLHPKITGTPHYADSFVETLRRMGT
jgi:hypothetical protein